MARRMPTVPDGWFDYSPFGTPIAETRIIAVKTPLKQAFNNGKKKSLESCQQVDYHFGVALEDEFTPTQLVERLKANGLNLRAVIDLTFTKRYYNPEEFAAFGVKYAKIMCPGKEIPNDIVYSQFESALSDFLKGTSNGDLVAVHCTHGLNRTGYLVCRYLIEHCGYTAERAIQGFNSARGYSIERVNYLEHLRNGCPPLLPKSPKSPVYSTSKPRPSDRAPGGLPHGRTSQNRQNGGRRHNSPHSKNRTKNTWLSDSQKRDSPYSLPPSSATNWAGHDVNGEGHGKRRVRHRRRRGRGRSREPSEHQVDNPQTSFHDRPFESSVSCANPRARGNEFTHPRTYPVHQDASSWHEPYSNSHLKPIEHNGSVNPRISFRDKPSDTHVNSQATGNMFTHNDTHVHPVHHQNDSPDKFDHSRSNGLTDTQEHFTGNGERYLFRSHEPPMYGGHVHGFHDPYPEPMYPARFQAPARHIPPDQRYHAPPPGWMQYDRYNETDYGGYNYGRPEGAFSRWSGN